MTDSPTETDALEALDQFLDALRQEFRSNPDMAHRVVKALGATVVFDGKLAATLINPKELVASMPEGDARAQLMALSSADLKAIAKTHNLGSAVDVKGKSKEELVDLVYVRAARKISERQAF